MTWDARALDAACRRLECIPWTRTREDAASGPHLVREYLRRAALWAAALGVENNGPFYDVVAAAHRHHPGLELPGSVILSEDARVSPTDPLERRVLETWQHLLANSVGGLHARLCLWFIRWQVAGHRPPLDGIALPPPYEPLIILFERDGFFTREHGYIDVGRFGLPPSRTQAVYKTIPPLALDPATLDALDQASHR